MKSIFGGKKQTLGNYTFHNNNAHATLTDIQASTATASSPTLGLNNNFINGTVAGRHDALSGYDTLQHPFKHDKQRGRWSSPVDFYFACTSHVFGINTFTEVPIYAVLLGGVYFLPAYILAILLYTIPIFIIQTFLGQFSNSGTISAFRVVPLFKGIGYSILILNLSILSYYALNASVPFVYAANSLHTVIPWMSCNNTWNSPNCSTHTSYDEDELDLPVHATVEFFRIIIRRAHAEATQYSINWLVVCGVIAVWVLVLAVLLKHVSFIGKLLRCLCLLMLTFFLAIFVHLLIDTDKDIMQILGLFVKSSPMNSTNGIIIAIHSAAYMAIWPLGISWGSILALASHNTFRRNSESLTYWVIGTHVLLTIMAIICGNIALDHFEDHVGFMHYHIEEEHFMQFLYICYAYLFGSFTSLPNFWCFLFFGMLFIAELCGMIVQMMTVLTAIFDEYESLRTKKTEITVGLVAFLLLASMYFCTKQGFVHMHMLPNIAVFTNVIISFIMLLMVTWIYGRARFQCDLQFMLGKTISNFKIFLLRFITPLFICAILAQLVFFVDSETSQSGATTSVLLITSQSIVYIIGPAYMVYKLCQMAGPVRKRLKKSLKPQDWYPVDADNRRFYEEIMGTSEMLVIECNDNQQPIAADYLDSTA